MIGSHIVVNQNDMTNDSQDPRCQLFLGSTGATNGMGELKIAFVTVVVDSIQMLKRYFGAWDWDDKEGSIVRIMDVGGKCPEPFVNLALPESGELD